MNKLTRTHKSSGIAFVGRKGGLAGHSGVSGYVAPLPASVKLYLAGSLTVALGGSRLLSTYVQQRPFYTAQNVAVLSPRDPSMPLLHRLFYAMCIRHNAFRYTAFGREANRTLRTIEVPASVPAWVNDGEIPTTAGLQRSLEGHVELTPPVQWNDFTIEDLFEVRKGKRVTKADRRPGTTRFIGASEHRNGVTDMCDLEPNAPAGTLTVVYNGNSVGFAFYQDEPYFACDDVNILVPRTELSKWALLFAATAIKHERPRFTYGFKWTLERMKHTTIRLPARDGDPDWAYAESVMRGLPFSAAIAPAD
ncbi:restriction endonuclease subunit S [Agromyces sp. Leaf222]|nr:restriction endonuclease subunit S [Agromyces sp. Leaf222]